MKKIIILLASTLLVICGCADQGKTSEICSVSEVSETLPVTGTFINLPYQDVRNKYTNPQHLDYTDPDMWKTKIAEMKKMGIEYLIFMSVANEGKSYYPSRLMGKNYPEWRKSPVDAVMDAAAEHGMKVFMSTGWAVDQDDNLRNPKIKARQIEMMTELAEIYGNHPAMYGWYLPVEDCFGPVLTDYAVEAVNALTARAKELTPSARTMISPYGIFNSNFDDPRYEQQLSRLKVDIIAYQDEVGCVREKYPLPRLRENWKKLRAIHDKTGVEMWANCESFAWEHGTNDRQSALIPAPFPRFLSQMAAAAEGGAEKIISFIICGLFEKPDSQYPLGQPYWSEKAYEDYMAWLGGDAYWKAAEEYFTSHAGPMEKATDVAWVKYKAGTYEVEVEPCEGQVTVAMLNYNKRSIVPPVKVSLYGKDRKWSLIETVEPQVWANTNHDAFVDHVIFDEIPAGLKKMKVTFTVEKESYIYIIGK